MFFLLLFVWLFFFRYLYFRRKKRRKKRCHMFTLLHVFVRHQVVSVCLSINDRSRFRFKRHKWAEQDRLLNPEPGARPHSALCVGNDTQWRGREDSGETQGLNINTVVHLCHMVCRFVASPLNDVANSRRNSLLSRETDFSCSWAAAAASNS